MQNVGWFFLSCQRKLFSQLPKLQSNFKYWIFYEHKSVVQAEDLKISFNTGNEYTWINVFKANVFYLLLKKAWESVFLQGVPKKFKHANF